MNNETITLASLFDNTRRILSLAPNASAKTNGTGPAEQAKLGIIALDSIIAATPTENAVAAMLAQYLNVPKQRENIPYALTGTGYMGSQQRDAYHGKSTAGDAGTTKLVYVRSKEQIALEDLQDQYTGYIKTVMLAILTAKGKGLDKKDNFQTVLDSLLDELVDKSVLEAYQKNKNILEWASHFSVGKPEVFQDKAGVVLFELALDKAKAFGAFTTANNVKPKLFEYGSSGDLSAAKAWSSFTPNELGIAASQQNKPAESVFLTPEVQIHVLMQIPQGFVLPETA